MKKVTLYLLLFTVINSVYSQDHKFGKIEKEALKETYYAKDSLCNAVYLYKERKTAFVFNQQSFSFEVQTKIHEKIKIYNTDGFENATQTITYYDPDTGSDNETVYKIKAYTYNLEKGKIKKEKLSSKNIFQNQKNKYWATKSFTMPNIKPGSIIEFSYTIRSPYWDIRDLKFQYEIPVKQLLYTTEIPEYFNFNTRNKGFYSITPSKRKLQRTINWVNKYRNENSNSTFQHQTINHSSELTTYKANDIIALKDNEPYVSNVNNYRGGVKYELNYTRFPDSPLKTYATNWESVTKNIYDSPNFGTELNYTRYFKDELELILKDKTTDNQKISAILSFVKTKVKWNNYSGKYTDKGVRKAYKEGSGNIAEINLMLVAMLREAGLTANPVLISTRDNGVPFFPTREGYNYVIAAVKSDNSEYILLDASEQYSSPNNLPLRDLNWNGRMISKSGNSTSISLAPTTYSQAYNILNITIDENFNTKGILRRKLDGLKALNYRAKNNKLKEEDLIEKIENKYQVDINNFRVINKEEPSKVLNQLIQFEGADLIEVINDKMYIDPLFFFTTKVNPFKLENRNYPVDFGAPWVEKNQININIPTGYKIEFIPENFGLGLPEGIGYFKFAVVTSATAIVIKSEEKFNSAIISSNYYTYLKSFYSEVVSKQKEKIILSKI